MHEKALFIVGPTGVGKTSLAFDLAAVLGGVLVSADSVQVFRDLDIISGKDIPEGYIYNAGYYSHNGSPSICLLDVVDPTSPFSVSDYLALSRDFINQIIAQGKLPIIVGGSGLYVKALMEGLDVEVAPDLELRDSLEKLTVAELQRLLPKDKLGALNDSDIKNKRRLIRGIEILRNSKTVSTPSKSSYKSLVIGLKCDREILKQRINDRVNLRIKEGAFKEAEVLFQNYSNLTQQVKDANGYRQLFQYLLGSMTLDEAIYRWKISEYRHAKNQMTWFEKYGNVEWHSILDNNFRRNIEKRVTDFLL